MTNEDFAATEQKLNDWINVSTQELFRRATDAERFQSNREFMPLEISLEAVHESVRNILSEATALRAANVPAETARYHNSTLLVDGSAALVYSNLNNQTQQTATHEDTHE